MTKENNFYLNRRDLMKAAGVLSLASGSLAGCSVLDRSNIQSSTMTELEIANEKLVTQFCLDWSTMDADLLGDYLADDLVYQMFEGRPDIIGKEAFVKLMKPFFKAQKSVEWEMIRSHVIGPIVINERIDHFNAINEKRSMHFGIAGYFLVKDKKIVVWRDFNMPGGIRKLGPL